MDPTEVIAATEAVVQATESVAEVVETVDYALYLETLVTLEQYQTSFLLFFVVVILCYFAYKFFRIFF